MALEEILKKNNEILDDIHEYATILNEELERIKSLHKSKNVVRIIFNKSGDFVRFDIER